jgi:hypothetical protein
LKAALGYSKTYIASDGSTQTFEVVGMKQPEQLGDEVLNLFVWIWSMKDYLKALCKQRGGDPNSIERIATAEPALAIAADIANGAKHGELKNSRTGKYATLSNVGFNVPSGAIGSITVGASHVCLRVANPEAATLRASIEFTTGEPPQDAFTVLAEAINAWEVHAFPLAGV